MEGHVILIGPMGAGKSTIGRLLAAALKFSFIDSDAEIELRAGADINWIFDKEGEAGFRDRETQALQSIFQQHQKLVVATGGGAVIRPINQQLIKRQGKVIYLHASVKQQLERVHKDRTRPLLRQGDLKNTLSQLMQFREPIYRSLADFTVDTDVCTQRQVVQVIIASLA